MPGPGFIGTLGATSYQPEFQRQLANDREAQFQYKDSAQRANRGLDMQAKRDQLGVLNMQARLTEALADPDLPPQGRALVQNLLQSLSQQAGAPMPATDSKALDDFYARKREQDKAQKKAEAEQAHRWKMEENAAGKSVPRQPEPKILDTEQGMFTLDPTTQKLGPLTYTPPWQGVPLAQPKPQTLMGRTPGQAAASRATAAGKEASTAKTWQEIERMKQDAKDKAAYDKLSDPDKTEYLSLDKKIAGLDFRLMMDDPKAQTEKEQYEARQQEILHGARNKTPAGAGGASPAETSAAAKEYAQGKIKVRRKADGQVGLVSPQFFDPNKYERVP